MSKLTPKHNQSGFTIIEALIYMGIASIMLTTIGALLGASYTTRIKNSVIQEVELQGAQTTQRITQSLRNSSSFTIPPSPGNNTLTLNLLSSNTEFYSIIGDNLNVTLNSDPAVPLHSGDITVSGLEFRNLTRTGTRGSVEFEFTLTYINNTGRSEYDYTKTFYGTGSLYHLGG